MAICLLPEQIQAQLVKRFANQQAVWLAGGGSWPFSLTLGMPSEKEALAEMAKVRAWSDAWRLWAQDSQGASLQYEERQWARLGKQALPVRLIAENAAQVAAMIGEGERWQRASQRYALMSAQWPPLASSPVLSRKYAELADYAEEDFTRLCSLLAWLQANPASGLYLRQLPVAGLDSKWAEQRKKLLLDLLRVLLNRPDENDLIALCGLQSAPERWRLRVLCPLLRQTLGGLGDIEAPLAQLAQLRLPPHTVLIVENLATCLALPDMAGCICLFGRGNAVTMLAQLPWLQEQTIFYWGDLDTHGFSFLHAARSVLPQVRSVLMDEATLLAHESLWGEEPSQQVEMALPLLNEAENTVYRGLHKHYWRKNLRLEQERIAWDYALARLAAAW